MICPLCPDCKHLDREARRGTFRCAAYPRGSRCVTDWPDNRGMTIMDANDVRHELPAEDLVEPASIPAGTQVKVVYGKSPDPGSGPGRAGQTGDIAGEASLFDD